MVLNHSKEKFRRDQASVDPPSSNEDELYNNPPNMWDIFQGSPFTEEEKRGGKIITYKELCRYMKYVRIRDENNTGELGFLRYENKALNAQA